MPEERFDIYDEHMNPIGTATRSETHANGYWHRSFHCWLTRDDGDKRYVWFQLRQLSKDTNPGCYDITVAGHLAAGETVMDASRELEEEIGVAASFEELVPLGQIREEDSGMAGGTPYIDREVSDVFALRYPYPLDTLRLQQDEVAGVFEAEIAELLSLFEGERAELSVQGVELVKNGHGRLKPATRTIRANEFVPRDEVYYKMICHKLMTLE
ncbi:NUDIX domain-containing protein [Paenibacillus sp. GCM10027627]|uniref:NUDIX hydrolase n=1 Tax=unclassified Paenibacillus TaxID=185978 RepID=UPI003641BE64